MQYQTANLYHYHSRQMFILPGIFITNSITVEALGDYHDHWKTLGYAYKIESFNGTETITDSRRLYLDYATLIKDFASPDGWRLGIKLHPWLFRSRDLNTIGDPLKLKIGVSNNA